MPTLRYVYMYIAIDFIIYYHSQKLGMANNVYLSPPYINAVDSVSCTMNIAKCHCTSFLDI